MPGPNQLDRLRDDVTISAQDLLQFGPEGPITEAGLRLNISVGVQYLGAWLNGIGCVPINNLMEDAATAEISRSQVWQWIHSERGVLDDGRDVDTELFRALLAEELEKIHGKYPESLHSYFDRAAELFDQISTSDEFVDFLTLPAYQMID
jgi:malate synthase